MPVEATPSADAKLGYERATPLASFYMQCYARFQYRKYAMEWKDPAVFPPGAAGIAEATGSAVDA